MSDQFLSLLKQELWQISTNHDEVPVSERIRLSYLRARSLALHLGMTVDDITQLSRKFWDFHLSMVPSVDTAAATILTIHWNLCMGTLARYAADRPDLSSILEQLERFDVCGEFMLTEFGHGLDARNIETSATLQSDGSFDLHTPCAAAAKVMPPTTLYAGIPRVAVVFARLVVDNQRYGIRPFLVRINSSDRMSRGITARLLPTRPGAKALDHAVTTFNHVRLEPSALLGELNPAQDTRADFFKLIQRVTVGTLSLSMLNAPSLKFSAYIAGRYSQKRHTAGRTPDERLPIITFSTQHGPILTAFAMSSVLESYANWTVKGFLENTSNPRVQSGLATAFKATAIHFTQPLINEMIDRCGWQGLFTHNQMSEIILALGGNSIAEGDILVLSLRLVSELFLGRYTLPEPEDRTSLLARHEAGVWEEAGTVVERILAEEGSHRDEGFNAHILPRCRGLICATGQRMAYEAAKASPNMRPELLRLYETTCVLDDPSWYVEHGGMSRAEVFQQSAEATQAALPLLEDLFQESGAAPWATAPILDDARWAEFVGGLPLFGTPGEHGGGGTEKGGKRPSKRLSWDLRSRIKALAAKNASFLVTSR